MDGRVEHRCPLGYSIPNQLPQGDRIPTAKRSFALKIVRFKSGRRRGFVPPAMDTLLGP